MNADGTSSEPRTNQRTLLISSGPRDEGTGPTGESGSAPFAAAPQSMFGRLLDRLLANAVRAVVLILVIALAIVALPIAIALICAVIVIVLISLIRARLRRGRSPSAWSTRARTEVVDAQWTVQESGPASPSDDSASGANATDSSAPVDSSSSVDDAPVGTGAESEERSSEDGRRNVRVRR